MAYVYRYIRLDKNIPFYVGIGNDDKYYRANSRDGRNRHWYNIINKSPYKVEIIFDNISWELACKKEIEFISYYKRTKDGGTLCNITLGGEGQLGLIPTNAYKKGSIPYSKGKPMPKHVKEAIVKANSGRPSWNKGISAKKESIEKQIQTKKERDVIYRGERHFMFGKKQPFEWREKSRLSRLGISPWNKEKKMSIECALKNSTAKNHLKISICQYGMDGKFIKEYSSINEASKISGIGKGNISLCCKNKRIQTGGFIWKIKGGDAPS